VRSDASDAADNVEAVNGAIAISAAVAKAIGFITVRHVIRVHAGRLEPNITSRGDIQRDGCNGSPARHAVLVAR